MSALGEESLPFNIVYIYGPGGVGKSTLLRTFAQACAHRGVPALYLDMRHVEPTPESFYDALRQAFNLVAQESRFALLLDTYELAQLLDDWMRETFLPGLPAKYAVCVRQT